jgi:hypothetical protein
MFEQLQGSRELASMDPFGSFPPQPAGVCLTTRRAEFGMSIHAQASLMFVQRNRHPHLNVPLMKRLEHFAHFSFQTISKGK